MSCSAMLRQESFGEGDESDCGGVDVDLERD